MVFWTTWNSDKSHQGSIHEPRSQGNRFFTRVTMVLTRAGVETQGVSPVPVSQQTDTKYYNIFFVWLAANCNVLTVSTGTLGPAIFELGLRDSCLVILCVNGLCCVLPASFAIFGPKLGLRSMIQARFSFGYYGAILPSILNLISFMGYLVLNCIVGGQTLASVSNGSLSDSVGIVIIALISLVVTLFGYKAIHWYESVAWAPSAVIFIIALGFAGKHLTTAVSTPATAATVLSFSAGLAGYALAWSTLVADYGVYYRPDVSSARVFLYAYLGFFCSLVGMQMIGACIVASAPYVPSWNDAASTGNFGTLIQAVLAPTGNVGKRILIIILALCVPSACAPTQYSFGTSFQAISPAFAKIPGYAYAVVSTAILIPVAIVGASHFYTTLSNFLGLIGYWVSAFGAIVVVEHVFYRSGRYGNYEVQAWNHPRRLPTGLAALAAFILSFGIITPCMNQAWFVGPIAAAGTGDIGFETGFVASSVLYLIFRRWDRKGNLAAESRRSDQEDAKDVLAKTRASQHVNPIGPV